MPGWLVVVIVILCLIVFYVLTGFLVRFLVIRSEKKVYDEMAKVAPVEDERLNCVKDVSRELTDHKYHINKQFLDLIDETDTIMTTRPIDVVQAKNNNDLLILYFRKYITEKKLDRQECFKKCLDELNAHFYENPNDKNSPYYKYNKTAAHYNAYFGLLLYSPFINKRKHQQASVF